MKSFSGWASNITRPVLGRVSYCKVNAWNRSKTILILTNPIRIPSGYAAIITCFVPGSNRIPFKIPCICGLSVDELKELMENDILLIEQSGIIHKLWEAESEHNTLIISHSCNCRCLMCPQPIQRDPEKFLKFNLNILKLVKKKTLNNIGLTGGEPTLRITDLCIILKFCKRHFPDASISILTNGRNFCDRSLAKKIASIGHPNLLIGVSLQADIETIHDQIIGANGGFNETVRGIHNLAFYKQRVEIRVVIMKNNYRRLPQIAEFIYRNFPFSMHIAFMGLEITGEAITNLDQVWIESHTYMPYLKNAVLHLHKRNLFVSIYNLPYCLLPRELWSFAKDSISDWKKIYLDLCKSCSVLNSCPGLFSTSAFQNEHLKPL